jgi:hypothetical protein
MFTPRRTDYKDCDLDPEDLKQHDFAGRADRMRLRSDRCTTIEEPPETPKVPPSGLPTPAVPDRSTPPVLVMQSGFYPLSCAEYDPTGPDKGETVEIAAGTFSLIFDWRTIPGITTDRLAFLARKDESYRSQIVTWAVQPKATVLASIKSAFKLTTEQAEYAHTTVYQTLDTLDNLVFLAAATALDCNYENVFTTVECPEDPEGSAAASISPNVPVDAGTFLSKLSQIDADEQAERFGEAQLECLYNSREVFVTCDADTDNPNLGFPDVVPTNVTTGQVGSVTLDAGYTSSSAGSTTATESATQIALSMLSCFYVSSGVTRDCSDIDTDGSNTADQDRVGKVADGLGPAETGWSVTVPEAYITSYVDQADANVQAVLIAESLLDCYWENEYTEIWCGGEAFDLPENPPAGATYVTSLPAGTLRSYISQADANANAEAIASVRLNCIYGNQILIRRCSLPAEAPRKTDCDTEVSGAESDELDWQLATSSVTKEVTEVYNIEEQLKTTTTVLEFYLNGGLLGTTTKYDVEPYCELVCPPGGCTPAPVTSTLEHTGFHRGLGLAVDSSVSGSAFLPVVIAPNSFIAPTAAEADTLAQNLSDSLINCLYSNYGSDYVFDECPSVDVDGEPTDVLEDIVPYSELAVTEVFAPAGMFLSPSQVTANASAKSYMQSLLYCVFGNDFQLGDPARCTIAFEGEVKEIEIDDPLNPGMTITAYKLKSSRALEVGDTVRVNGTGNYLVESYSSSTGYAVLTGYSPVAPGTVSLQLIEPVISNPGLAADTFLNESKTAANNQAKNLADALVICDQRDFFVPNLLNIQVLEGEVTGDVMVWNASTNEWDLVTPSEIGREKLVSIDRVVSWEPDTSITDSCLAAFPFIAPSGGVDTCGEEVKTYNMDLQAAADAAAPGTHDIYINYTAQAFPLYCSYIYGLYHNEGFNPIVSLSPSGTNTTPPEATAKPAPGDTVQGYIHVATFTKELDESISSCTRHMNSFSLYETRAIPVGENKNDILKWVPDEANPKNSKWEIFPADGLSDANNYYLKIEGGSMKWQIAGACPE